MEYTEDEAIREVGSYLIYVRQIPNYYFRRKLRAMGVPEERVARSEPNRWVSVSRQVKIRRGPLYRDAARMFTEIHNATAHHRPAETHAEARERLRSEMTRLTEQQFTTATIGLNLRLSIKVVQKMMEFGGRDDAYTTHCPWEMLDRMAATDWETTDGDGSTANEPVTPFSITEGEIQHQRHRDLEAARLRAQTEVHYIETGGRCWNCAASWSSMMPEPRRKNERDLEVRCRICSRISKVRAQPGR